MKCIAGRCSCTTSETVFNFTKEQGQVILTNVGVAGLAMDTVMEAMSFILGQDSKADNSGRSGKACGKTAAYYHREEDEDYDGSMPEPRDSQMPIYFEQEEDRQDELWRDDGQEYYQDDAAGFINEPIYDVDEYDGVYATYYEAKAKLNAIKMSRGVYPAVVCLEGGSKGGTRRAKGTQGMIKKGKTQDKPKGEKGPSPNPKGRAAAAGVGKTLRCGQPGRLRERGQGSAGRRGGLSSRQRQADQEVPAISS